MNLCKACLHKKRRDIDRQLAQGVPGAEVARRFGVPPRSIYNHVKKHLHHQLVSAVRKQKDRHEVDLADDLFNLVQRAKAILDVAEADGRLPLALKAIGETRSTIITLAQIAEMIEKSRAAEIQTTQRLRIEELKSKLSRQELESLLAILGKLEGRSEQALPPPRPFRVPDDGADEADEAGTEADAVDETDVPTNNDATAETDKPENGPGPLPDPEGLTWEERMRPRPLREVADAHVVRAQRIRERAERKREARPRTFLDDAVAGSVRIKTLLR